MFMLVFYRGKPYNLPQELIKRSIKRARAQKKDQPQKAWTSKKSCRGKAC